MSKKIFFEYNIEFTIIDNTKFEFELKVIFINYEKFN